jgi:hypothetical protein
VSGYGMWIPETARAVIGWWISGVSFEDRGGPEHPSLAYRRIVIVPFRQLVLAAQSNPSSRVLGTKMGTEARRRARRVPRYQ